MNRLNRTYTVVMLAAVVGVGLAGWGAANPRPQTQKAESPAAPPQADAGHRSPAPLMARAAAPTMEPGDSSQPPQASPPPAAGPAAAPAPGGAEGLGGLVIPPRLIREHRVLPGESLKRIAAQYRITPDLIASLNHLSNRNRIVAGQTLKVIQGPFDAVVEKSAFRLDVLLGGEVVRSFRIGLGVNGSTPTGRWRVKDKLLNPAWVNPLTRQRYAADDPANPIGEHWLGLEGQTGDAVGKLGFGIHGTIEPESIGKSASLGCVRMLPADVAVVYQLLVDGASTVEIR